MRRIEYLKESLNKNFYLSPGTELISWFLRLSKQRPRHTKRILKSLSYYQSKELLRIVKISSGYRNWPDYVINILTYQSVGWYIFNPEKTDIENLVLAC